MFEKSLQKIRDGIMQFADDSRKLKAELSKALDDRQDLLLLPLPKDDFILKIQDAVDRGMGNSFPNSLKHRLAYELENPNTTTQNPSFNVLAGISGRDIEPSALLWCLGPQIKEGIARAIQTWPWPAEVGLPRAERAKQLAVLDKRIGELQSKLDAIKHIADEQSVAIRGVESGSIESARESKRKEKEHKRLRR
ncbi:hypothetical protein [Desulfocastanea catecholica]